MNSEQILSLLFEYMPKIAEERKTDSLLILMADLGRSLVSADRCSLWLLDEKEEFLWTKVAHGVDILKIPASSGFVGHTLKTGEALLIEDAYLDPRFDISSDKKTKYRTKSVLTVPLKNSQGIVFGVFQAINKKEELATGFTKQDLEYLSLTSVYSAKSIESMVLTEEIEETQAEILEKLGRVSEYRSKETYDHVFRVAQTSYKLALFYGLSEIEAEEIRRAAMMHDLGKVGIPDAILQKTGRFTEEEFTIMKNHTTIGYDLLKDSSKSLLRLAADIAYYHHEHWSGKGYPNGLVGEEIPLASRICAIADVLDALASPRCYKDPWPEVKVREIFEKERNQQFQGELIDILFENWDLLFAPYKDIVF